jgi:hypothetical protein
MVTFLSTLGFKEEQNCRQLNQQVGEDQGQNSGQSGVPLQGDQMQVLMSQDAVSGNSQKFAKTVCAPQIVDGEKTNYSRACFISASAACEIAQEKAQSGHSTVVKSLKWVKQKNIISSGEFLSINSRFCGSYSELLKI